MKFLILCVVIGVAYAQKEELVGEAMPKPEPIPNKETEASEDGAFEGDMMLPKGEGGADRNMINGDHFRWPKKGRYIEVPYVLTSSLSQQKRQMFEASAKDYAMFTCVKFVPRTSQSDYIEVFNSQGCWSMVGKQGGKQQLSLGDGCEYQKGTSTHEMMHALGFFHEQSRSDRDQYVTIYRNNVESNQLHNFDICDDTKCTRPNYGYDFDSVMHYEGTAFSKDRRSITIAPKAGQKVKQLGQRAGLSRMDIKKIAQMYNCGSTTVERNNGQIPGEQPLDKYTNCGDLKAMCASPSNNYDILENCPKTCQGVKKGDNYNMYNNCDSLTHACSYDDNIKTNCSYACNGNRY